MVKSDVTSQTELLLLTTNTTHSLVLSGLHYYLLHLLLLVYVHSAIDPWNFIPGYCFQTQCYTVSESVGLLVVLRIYAILAIFQPYHNWKQEISNLWNCSGEAGNRTPRSFVLQAKRLTTTLPLLPENLTESVCSFSKTLWNFIGYFVLLGVTFYRRDVISVWLWVYHTCTCIHTCSNL